MPNIAKTCLTALAISLLGTSLALAQTPTPDPAQAPPSQKGCTPQEKSNQTLQKSDQTAGVMCPPDVDPAMKAPTPKTSDPSVIAPPAASQSK
jgi:hypothetical protein